MHCYTYPLVGVGWWEYPIELQFFVLIRETPFPQMSHMCQKSPGRALKSTHSFFQISRVSKSDLCVKMLCQIPPAAEGSDFLWENICRCLSYKL